MDNILNEEHKSPVVQNITSVDIDKANTLTKEEFAEKFNKLYENQEQISINHKKLHPEESPIFEVDDIKSEEDIEKLCKSLKISVEDFVKELEKEAEEDFDKETIDFINNDNND